MKSPVLAAVAFSVAASSMAGTASSTISITPDTSATSATIVGGENPFPHSHQTCPASSAPSTGSGSFHQFGEDSVKRSRNAERSGKTGDKGKDEGSREDPKARKKGGSVIPIAAAVLAAEFVAATCCTAGNDKEQYIAKDFPNSGSEDQDGKKVSAEIASDWGPSYPESD